MLLTTKMFNVFVRGDNGHLLERLWNGFQWDWVDLGPPPGTRMVAAPAVVGWDANDGGHRFNVFVQGDNGHLLESYYNGQWQWTDHGLPPGTLMASVPAVIGWNDDGTQRLNVFFQGANGNLIERFWDGGGWQWTDHGLPPGALMPSAPAVAGWNDDDTQHLDVFFQGANGQLLETFFDGQRWQWTDHGHPPGTLMASAPAVAVWKDDDTQRLNVFFQGANEHLIERFWDGGGWQWTDRPVPIGRMVSAPGAITWEDDGTPRINVFFQGSYAGVPSSTPILVEFFWDGERWQWNEHPPGYYVDPFLVQPAPIWTGESRVYIWSRQGNLDEAWWDDQLRLWQWRNHPLPPGVQAASAPAATVWYFQIELGG